MRVKNVKNSVGIAINLDDQSYSHKHATDSFPIIIITLLKLGLFQG